MNNETVRLIMEREGQGFSAWTERKPCERITDIVVNYRPRTLTMRTSVSDTFLEVVPEPVIDHAVGAIEDCAARARGAMIVEVLSSGRAVKFPRHLPPERVSGLVSGLLGALDDSRGLEQKEAYVLGLRVVDIVIKHGDLATCERLALMLMERAGEIQRRERQEADGP